MVMPMGFMGGNLAGLGSMVAGIMFISAIFQQYFPQHLRDLIEEHAFRLLKLMNPNMQITIHHESGGHFSTNEAYTATEGYLSTHSVTQGNRLKADMTYYSPKLVLNLADGEEITDYFEGAKLRWCHHVTTVNNRFSTDEKRSFTLSFRKNHRQLVVNSYLPQVIEKGKAVVTSNRQRRLYTNDPEGDWDYVAFQHPVTFRNLAMDPSKKKEIQDDLMTFISSKDYYANIGKAWKRGYLLYGPPGTGKTTMIAAIANLLNFDIYDLELTAVKNNTDLRRLMIDTRSKSIIVIEDIDCSLDLTGKRKEKGKDDEEGGKGKGKDKDKDADRSSQEGKKESKDKDNSSSKVTLSGLLNFIDGLWSACGEERIIIFTTNHVDKLDPALIRSGRMDMHIKMSYCCFEAFKILARNYLNIDAHPLFDTIRVLLEEIQITPADVAENLMPKTIKGDANTSLNRLIKALHAARDKKEELAESTKKMKIKEEEQKKSMFRWHSRSSFKKKNKAIDQSLLQDGK